jgi:hypothetical protein
MPVMWKLTRIIEHASEKCPRLCRNANVITFERNHRSPIWSESTANLCHSDCPTKSGAKEQQ